MMRNPGFGLDSFYAKGAKGCIVELYQFRCTDESLPLRILSGSKSMHLLGGRGETVFIQNIRADSGQN